MSWLDRTLVLPTVGILLSPRLCPNADLLRSLSPVIDSWESDQIDVGQSSLLDLELNDRRGFTLKVDHQNVVASFKLRPALKRRPGRAPELEYSEPMRKFSELLDDALSRTEAVMAALLAEQDRGLVRIGLVAGCNIDAATPLPGVERLLGHLAAPWGTELTVAEGRFLATVSKGSGFHDRCHHHLAVNQADRPGEQIIALDYQRVFDAPVPVRAKESKTFTGALSDVRGAALSYFDRFAKGDLAYGG